MFCHVRRELERSEITATFSNKKRKTSGVVFTLMVSISTAGDTRDFRDGKKKLEFCLISRHTACIGISVGLDPFSPMPLVGTSMLRQGSPLATLLTVLQNFDRIFSLGVVVLLTMVSLSDNIAVFLFLIRFREMNGYMTGECDVRPNVYKRGSGRTQTDHPCMLCMFPSYNGSMHPVRLP